MVKGRQMHRVDRPRDHAEDEPHRQGRADVDRQHGDESIPGRLLAEVGGELAAEPQGEKATRRDARDPGQLPHHALEVAEHRRGGEDSQHHEVVAFNRHRAVSPDVRQRRRVWGEAKCRDSQRNQRSPEDPGIFGYDACAAAACAGRAEFPGFPVFGERRRFRRQRCT